jgi:hypothetical protein
VTSTAAIVDAFKHVIQDLADKRDDPNAVQVAAAMSRWINGQDFDTAARLVRGWRSHLRLTDRNRALASLLKLHADMNASELAAWIVEGLQRVGASANGVRPDGADGYLADLVRAGRNPGKRQWHRLITEARLPFRSLNGKGDSVTVHETGGKKLGTEISTG